MAGCIDIPGGVWWRCVVHGRVEASDLSEPRYRQRQTSLGRAWVIADTAVLDAVPAILQTLEVFLLEDELEWLRSVDERERTAFWRRREKAVREEVDLRAASPRRDVFAGKRSLRQAWTEGWVSHNEA